MRRGSDHSLTRVLGNSVCIYRQNGRGGDVERAAIASTFLRLELVLGLTREVIIKFLVSYRPPPQNCSPSSPPNVLLPLALTWPLPSTPVLSPCASLSSLLLNASTCAPDLRAPITHPGTLHPVPGNISFLYACPSAHPTAAGNSMCGNCDSASCSGRR